MKKFAMQHTVVAALLAATSASVWATDGYFSHGYGIKAKGMGGAAVASTDNAFAGANNPASAAFAGNRIEAGVDWFMPDRAMQRTNGANPLTASDMTADVTSDSKSFLIPEFGYNKVHNNQISYGVTVYGNGGMNTNYAGGQATCGGQATNVLCGSGRLGVDLIQLIVAPTMSFKLDDNNAIGLSPLIIMQQFKADGLQAFQQNNSQPTKVTNNGYSRSDGVGIRLGYLGKINDRLNIGASYSPKTKMGKFDKYAGLFAEAGGFDIPENYSLGFTYQATSQTMVAFDYQRISYSKVASIGNASLSNMGNGLGAPNGPGFGWSDVNVLKLGVQWQASPQLQLRAGYNHSTNPIKSSDVSFNILAPGVITDHYTLGGTYALDKSGEVSFYFMHAPKQSVSGASMYNAAPPNGLGLSATETIRMSQQSLGVQYGWKF